MSERFKVVFAYVAVCTIWGSTWLVIKVGLEYIPPLISAGLRFLVAAAILWGIIKFRGITIPMHAQARWFYLGVTLASFSIPFALVYWGEGRISSGLTAILFAVYPFCVAIFSALMLKSEKLTVPKIAGIILGFLGIVVIFGNDVSFGNNIDSLLGMGAVVLSAVLQGFSAIIIKKYGHDISPFVVSFVPMLVSAFLLLVSGVVLEDMMSIQFNSVSIFSIIFLALFGSVTTFVSYFWLIKRVEVVYLSLTSFITPIIATVLGIIILHEQVSSQLFAGAALVLVGIMSANAPDIIKILRRRFLTQ